MSFLSNPLHLRLLIFVLLHNIALNVDGILTIDFSEIQSDCERWIGKCNIGPPAKLWDESSVRGAVMIKSGPKLDP